MKSAILFALGIMCLTFGAAVLLAQIPDLSGTWVGDTDIPNSTAMDHVTLVLKKAGDTYTGTITMAKAKDAPLENFKWEDEDTFNFEFVTNTGGDKARMNVKLDIVVDKILGIQLMGAWSVESGDYGTLDLEKKK